MPKKGRWTSEVGDESGHAKKKPKKQKSTLHDNLRQNRLIKKLVQASWMDLRMWLPQKVKRIGLFREKRSQVARL